MSTFINGLVTNGLIVPAVPLPDGTEVEVRVTAEVSRPPSNGACRTAGELLKLQREQRDLILSASAALAEELYRTDKELMGFDAFSEELDDDSTEG